LAATTLARLGDNELKLPPEQEAFTLAEMLQRLSAAILSELDKLPAADAAKTPKPAIRSLRRALQSRYVERLGELALGKSAAPQEAQALASAELETLEGKVKRLLTGKTPLDAATRAHLADLAATIRRTLDARVERKGP